MQVSFLGLPPEFRLTTSPSFSIIFWKLSTGKGPSSISLFIEEKVGEETGVTGRDKFCMQLLGERLWDGGDMKDGVATTNEGDKIEVARAEVSNEDSVGTDCCRAERGFNMLGKPS